MKVKDIGEFELIEMIKGMTKNKSSQLQIGIGDDAAAIKISKNQSMVISTDMLIEKVHFDLKFTSFKELGYKALAVNLSDIAAMGAQPKYALITLGIPASIKINSINEFYQGLLSLAKEFKVELIGGDTTYAKQLVINVQVIGIINTNKIIKRKGAKPGDYIVSNGFLGDSALGLEVLKKKIKVSSKDGKYLTDKHLKPKPQINLGLKLSQLKMASSMIDNSDGLGRCLREICFANKVGAEIYYDQIPVSPAARNIQVHNDISMVDMIFNGGEDYNLIFTVPPQKIKTLLYRPNKLFVIGKITHRKKGMSLYSGKKINLNKLSGYEHF